MRHKLTVPLTLMAAVRHVKRFGWPGARLILFVGLCLLLAPAPLSAQTATPETVTLSPPLTYKNRTYSVQYRTRGALRDTSPAFFFKATPDFFKAQAIDELIVLRDGQRVTDETELSAIFTLYRTAYIMYETALDLPLGSVPDGFRDDLHRVTHNPVFIALEIPAFLRSRSEETLEAYRTILSQQISEDEVKSYIENTRRGVENGKSVADALDASFSLLRYSNNRAQREFHRNVRDFFKNWRPVKETTSYIDIGRGERLELFNGLDVIAWTIQMYATADLNRERGEWLRLYQARLNRGASALDDDQVKAMNSVLAEVESAWVQRADIALAIARDVAVQVPLRVAEKKLSEFIINQVWKHAGRRVVGHWWAGAASAVTPGLIIGELLYGIGPLYEKYRVAERNDELRERFYAGRLSLQQQARSKKGRTYDGDVAEVYRAAYMLEALAASQAQRSYADGVEATVPRGLMEVLNPISWFKGTEWREAVAGLRDLAQRNEREAETQMGHPAFVPAAVELARQGYPPSPLPPLPDLPGDIGHTIEQRVREWWADRQREIERWWEGVRRDVERWWEQERDRFERQTREWFERQAREIERAVRQEIDKLLRQTCASVWIPGGLMLLWLTRRRQRRP